MLRTHLRRIYQSKSQNEIREKFVPLKNENVRVHQGFAIKLQLICIQNFVSFKQSYIYIFYLTSDKLMKQGIICFKHGSVMNCCIQGWYVFCATLFRVQEENLISCISVLVRYEFVYLPLRPSLSATTIYYLRNMLVFFNSFQHFIYFLNFLAMRIVSVTFSFVINTSET